MKSESSEGVRVIDPSVLPRSVSAEGGKGPQGYGLSSGLRDPNYRRRKVLTFGNTITGGASD